MNISANQVVQHIEEKVVTLRKGLTNGEEETIKECAAAIEAYCQLLKGMSSKAQSKEVEVNKQFVASPSHPVKESTEDELGNLLDF